MLRAELAALDSVRHDPKVAQAAYGRYGDAINWRTLQAHPLPTYDKLPPDHLRGWAAAVEEVKRQIRQRAGLLAEPEK